MSVIPRVQSSKAALSKLDQFSKVYAGFFTPPVMVLTFVIVYIAATTVFQIVSDIPPWRENAPIEFMNGSLIWMCAAISLVMAAITRDDPIRSLMWFAGTAALGFVALDEIFGIHEAARHIADDDDPKILMVMGAAVALIVLASVESLRGLCRRLLIIGYALQFAYLMSDMGDGDFFDIRFGHRDVLRWIEEYLEVSAMSFYFAAFMLILVNELRPGPLARAGGKFWRH